MSNSDGKSGLSSQTEKSSRLPVKEANLWPPGELLRLEGLKYLGQSHAEGIPVAVLTQNELRIWTAIAPSGEPGRGYGFDMPICENITRIPTSDITRVAISHWGVTTVLRVWARVAGRTRRILKMYFVEDLPSSIVELVQTAFNQGVVKPGILNVTYMHRFFEWELERQFKRAAPNATVVLRGRNRSGEDFSRLVL